LRYTYPQYVQNYEIAKLLLQTAPTIDLINFATSIAVSPWSYAGHISTISNPINCDEKASINSKISKGSSPKGSGVLVLGHMLGQSHLHQG